MRKTIDSQWWYTCSDAYLVIVIKLTVTHWCPWWPCEALPAKLGIQFRASRGFYQVLLVKPAVSSYRACFSDLQRNYFVVWLVLDYFSDTVYIADLFIRLRTGEWAPGLHKQHLGCTSIIWTPKFKELNPKSEENNWTWYYSPPPGWTSARILFKSYGPTYLCRFRSGCGFLRFFWPVSLCCL